MLFKRLWINWLVKHRVLPALSNAALGTEEFIYDKPTLRIKIEVTESGHRKFAIHQLCNKGKTWSYTTYNADEAQPFAIRSGSYPGSWDK